MKYYIDTATEQVWAFESDGSQDEYIRETMRPMTEQEVYNHLNPPPTHAFLVGLEDQWRENELLVVASQLLALEEAEAAAEEGLPPPPDLLPGTRNKWLAYRTKLRAWKESDPVFPNSLFRPERPK